VDKKAIRNYCTLRRELEQVNSRIQRLDREIESMESGAVAADVVTKGKRGGKPLGTVTITGFPDKRYQELKRQRVNAKILNESLADRIRGQMLEVEEFICNVEDSEMRQILRELCTPVRCPTWQQLANRLNRRGGMYTSESVRKKVERFLENS